MNRLSPLPGYWVPVFLGVDQLLARHTQLAQSYSAQVDQLQIPGELDLGMRLTGELILVEALEACGVGYVVEHRLHQRTWQGRTGVQRRDRLAPVVADRAEARIALDARVELHSGTLLLMHALQRLSLGKGRQSDFLLTSMFVAGLEATRRRPQRTGQAGYRRSLDQYYLCAWRRKVTPLYGQKGTSKLYGVRLTHYCEEVQWSFTTMVQRFNHS